MQLGFYYIFQLLWAALKELSGVWRALENKMIRWGYCRMRQMPIILTKVFRPWTDQVTPNGRTICARKTTNSFLYMTKQASECVRDLQPYSFYIYIWLHRRDSEKSICFPKFATRHVMKLLMLSPFFSTNLKIMPSYSNGILTRVNPSPKLESKCLLFAQSNS